jgi:hypothetical protein
MNNFIFYNPWFQTALKYMEEYTQMEIKYGKVKCEKAKELSKCTPYSFIFCVNLADNDLDAAIAKFCKYTGEVE